MVTWVQGKNTFCVDFGPRWPQGPCCILCGSGVNAMVLCGQSLGTSQPTGPTQAAVQAVMPGRHGPFPRPRVELSFPKARVAPQDVFGLWMFLGDPSSDCHSVALLSPQSSLLLGDKPTSPFRDFPVDQCLTLLPRARAQPIPAARGLPAMLQLGGPYMACSLLECSQCREAHSHSRQPCAQL